MALPGSMYVYQGDELGLPEVEDIPHARRQDPMWLRSGGLNPGRDGCRVPLPWSGERPPYGFSPAPVSTWLDQPAGWGELTVAAQSADPDSMLALYREGLRLRRSAPWGNDGGLRWLPSAATAIAFARGARFACIVNFGPQPVELPAHARILIASDTLEGGLLLQDTTVWLSQQEGEGAPHAVSTPPRGHENG
jgi:alpha-glucosidase